MFHPVLKSVCLARGYGNRIHIKMIKFISKIDEREREREREREYIEKESDTYL